jgi:hypothetical protein
MSFYYISPHDPARYELEAQQTEKIQEYLQSDTYKQINMGWINKAKSDPKYAHLLRSNSVANPNTKVQPQSKL